MMSTLSSELLMCFDDSSVGRLFSLVNIQTSEVAHKNESFQKLVLRCPFVMTNLTPVNP